MLFLLPRDIHSTKFLSPADKAWLGAAHAASKKQQMHSDTEASSSLKPLALLRDAASNYKIWLCGLTALCKNAALVGILFWAPIIVDSIIKGSSIDMTASSQALAVKGHGHRGLAAVAAAFGKARGKHKGSRSSAAAGDKGVTAVLLTSIPFVCAAVSAVMLGHRSQQQREKCGHVAVPYAVATVLFLLFPYIVSIGGTVTFISLTLAVTMLTAPNAILNSLAASVSAGRSSALGLALYNAVGNVGGLFGPWLIGKVVQGTGLYAVALQVLGLMIGAAAGMCWWMHRHWRL